MKNIILAIAVFCCNNSRADEKQIAYAQDLKVHNLNEKATEAFLSILHQTENPDTKALCLFNLGELALQSNNEDLARLDWKKIIENYPDTKESKLATEKLRTLDNDAVDSTAGELDEALGKLKSSIAINYLDNASFFSGASERFTIDTSWLPKEEFAAYWCDRVIEEFPNSKAHELALRKKFFIFKGWEDRYNEYGLALSESTYLEKMKQIIAETEKHFGESNNLPGMYYAIGQHYWPDNRTNAEEWFEKSANASGEGGYYYELVKWRLHNWRGRVGVPTTE